MCIRDRAWVLSNHDVPRVATRYALPQIKATRYHQIALDWLLRDGSSYDEDRELGERRARAALLLELALPGDVYKRQPETSRTRKDSKKGGEA